MQKQEFMLGLELRADGMHYYIFCELINSDLVSCDRNQT